MKELQLSEEMDIKINKIVNMQLGEINGIMVIFEPKAVIDELKHFLAQALEDQRIQIYREIEDDFRLRVLDIQRGNNAE